MEVAQGVHRLGMRFVNWYVIEDGGKLTVVDAGLPKQWGQLDSLLASLGKQMSDVEAVVISHYHADHLGLAEKIRKESGARVMAHAEDADAVRAGGSRVPVAPTLKFLLKPFMLKYLMAFVTGGGVSAAPVAEVATFTDGEVLDVPGKPQVIHTPGHSPGNSALLLADRDVLFSLDALITIKLPSGEPGPTLIPAPFTVDPALANASLDRLAATRASTVLPGHGEPWTAGIDEAVRLARADL